MSRSLINNFDSRESGNKNKKNTVVSMMLGTINCSILVSNNHTLSIGFIRIGKIKQDSPIKNDTIIAQLNLKIK